MAERTTRIYRFGPFVLDVADRSLKRDGAPISLTPKTFDLLVALVENAGRLIEKNTLLQRVWPDVAVEEGNLTKGVFGLRQVLEGNGPTRYIETVPKRGYRFTADVTSAQQEAPARSPALVAATAVPQKNSIAVMPFTD
jgi:DNA-binding winged helix-turn-helix (wHTH) protein